MEIADSQQSKTDVICGRLQEAAAFSRKGAALNPWPWGRKVLAQVTMWSVPGHILMSLLLPGPRQGGFENPALPCPPTRAHGAPGFGN